VTAPSVCIMRELQWDETKDRPTLCIGGICRSKRDANHFRGDETLGKGVIDDSWNGCGSVREERINRKVHWTDPDDSVNTSAAKKKFETESHQRMRIRTGNLEPE
jgi:hypothetical protein